MSKASALGLITLVLCVYVFLLWWFMIVWNAVIPDVCGFTTITMWQSFLITLLGGMVVGTGSHR